MNREKIALQLYSVREDMERDFYGTLRAVRELGYRGVEFAGLFDHDPKEVADFCRGIGLEIVSAHVPFQVLMADMAGTIACYKTLGCKHVVVPYLTEDLRPGQPGFQSVIDGIKVLGEALGKEGMVLQYHNHDFEFVKLDGRYALDILYSEVGPELLQTQLDTCWVNVGGEDPVGYIGKYAGRMPTIHLKDFVGSKSEHMYGLIGLDEGEQKSDKFELRPLGKGVQNFPAIVEAADKGGAEWFIVEQDMPSLGLTPMECAAESIRYLLTEIAG